MRCSSSLSHQKFGVGISLKLVRGWDLFEYSSGLAVEVFNSMSNGVTSCGEDDRFSDRCVGKTGSVSSVVTA